MADEDPWSYVEHCVSNLRDAPQAWFARNWLKARGLKDATVRDYFLGFDPDRDAVVIPYLNALSEVRAYRWRNLNGFPKYMQPKGSQLHLFHVKASKHPHVWLCEGEFDAMVLDQCGYPTVGIPGVSAFKEEWAYLFAYCESVTVVFDSDEAGRDGAAKLARLLSPFVNKVRLVHLPPGKDVTDLYLEDKAKLLKLVA